MQSDIFEAEHHDLPQIMAIWNSVIRNSTATFTDEEKTEAGLSDWHAERRACGEAVLVARQKGLCIGFAAYFPFRNGRGYRFTKELTIYVAPEAQNSGVGRRLLSRLEAHAAAAGVHSLWAGCSATNAGSVRFHARHGYLERARLPEVGYKFGQWIDLILMQKILFHPEHQSAS